MYTVVYVIHIKITYQKIIARVNIQTLLKFIMFFHKTIQYSHYAMIYTRIYQSSETDFDMISLLIFIASLL